MRCTAGRRASSPSRRRCCALALTSSAPIGADQHDPFVDEVAGQEVEQVPRQRVGPVQILERDDGHPATRQRTHQFEDRAEQPAGRRPSGPASVSSAAHSRSGASAGPCKNVRLRSSERRAAGRPAAPTESARPPSERTGRTRSRPRHDGRPREPGSTCRSPRHHPRATPRTGRAERPPPPARTPPTRRGVRGSRSKTKTQTPSREYRRPAPIVAPAQPHAPRPPPDRGSPEAKGIKKRGG